MKITHIFLMSAALALTACNSGESRNQDEDAGTEKIEEANQDGHTGHEHHNHEGHSHDTNSSNNETDMGEINNMAWVGTYQTMAACLSCDGVIKEIVLKSDMSYLQSVKHHGDHIGDVVEAGRFTWTDEEEQVLVISAGTDVETQYDLEGTQLIGLNSNGAQRVGEGYELYTLTKLNDDQPISGVNWVLKAIDGQELAKPEGRGEAIINFADSGKITGSGSCNDFNGSYKLDGEGGISFGPMAMTKKMCGDMRVEDQFIQGLPTVKTYKLHGGILSLYADGGAATFRFEKAK